MNKKKKKKECVDTCLLEKIVIWCSHDILDPTFIIFASPGGKKFIIFVTIYYEMHILLRIQIQAYETLFNIIVFSKPNNHFLFFSFLT